MSPRKSRDIPTLSGVYQIRCKANGKIYVGSAVNLQSRWHAHRRDLRNRVHVNPHLQFAWNLCGEMNFEFSVLEYVDEHWLLATEQFWIDKTACTDRSIGFNVKLEATSAGQGIGRTWDGFRDPGGNPVTIVNLADFCRRNRLSMTAMSQLFKGRSKLKSHKGWTHVNSVRQREFIKTHDGFIDPHGRAIGPIRNLAAFCREHGLDNTHMTAGLCKVHMFELKNGKRPSHKGWTWKYDADKAFG